MDVLLLILVLNGLILIPGLADLFAKLGGVTRIILEVVDDKTAASVL